MNARNSQFYVYKQRYIGAHTFKYREAVEALKISPSRCKLRVGVVFPAESRMNSCNVSRRAWTLARTRASSRVPSTLIAANGEMARNRLVLYIYKPVAG